MMDGDAVVESGYLDSPRCTFAEEGVLGETPGAASASEDVVEVTYYTDPLCCWSWALEPQWRRLRYEYGGLIRWKYRMGGLIANWSSYDDPIHSVSRPAQMGPVWMQAGTVSGMPVRHRLWMEDAPSSSYPACIAVKAAGLQSAVAAELYLRRLREAVMIEGWNPSRFDVLHAVAERLNEEMPSFFDFATYLDAFEQGGAARAFQDDLREVRYRDITRFPTLVLCLSDRRGVMIVGFRPYEALRLALLEVAPDLQPVRPPPDDDVYAAYWGGVLTRELEELRRSST